MYDEPYRWVEAVGNRRQYLAAQFKEGSPVVALPYADGILLLTVSRGTPKLYEIYDRIGLAGMGHPADLEKLRFSLLEMAHLEGFNRSPADVTSARLMKYGLAPQIKQAFEEIFKAPLIVKILLAELSLRPGHGTLPADIFLSVNYDGSFEETTGAAVLAATPAVQTRMLSHLQASGSSSGQVGSLAAAFDRALRSWAVGSLCQDHEGSSEVAEPQEGQSDVLSPAESGAAPPDDTQLWAHLRHVLGEKRLECAVLDRHAPGASKYRMLKPDELPLPEPLRPA